MKLADFETAPYAPLPPSAQRSCGAVNMPSRLAAHLVLVHDVAFRLVKALRGAFPELQFDEESILFGAATHDLGSLSGNPSLLWMRYWRDCRRTQTSG